MNMNIRFDWAKFSFINSLIYLKLMMWTVSLSTTLWMPDLSFIICELDTF